ncbi:S24 family peptidase [Halarcobacter sp.]|uniref:S24 family peptidase n=1 Tax=Halarcobacter sp. TaxID=2321133 RepID=UPI002AA918CA|nr:S24 family peptidase [Halarcobacter sp.]
MQFSNNLKFYRNQVGLSQGVLAQKVEAITGKKTTYENIKSWENGTNVKISDIYALAEALNIPEQLLFDNSQRTLKKISKYQTVQANSEDFIFNNSFEDDSYTLEIYNGAVGAGSEGVIEENNAKKIRVSKAFVLDANIKPDNLMLFKVVGDSMEPTISMNDWVIIDMANGRCFYEVDGIYLVNIDDTIQIKRLHFRGTKGIDIISDNKEFPKLNSINDCDRVTVIGKLYTHIKIGSGLALK